MFAEVTVLEQIGFAVVWRSWSDSTIGIGSSRV